MSSQSVGSVNEPLKEKIQQWIDFLFSDFRSIGLFYCVTQNLYGELAGRCALSAEDSPTETGVVLNPTHAGQCLTEVQRTESFVRGLDQAVCDRLSQGSSPVHIFYAGCGPFATLILPLTFRYTTEEVQIYLLDYHQQSIDSAQKLLADLGKTNYLAGTVVHDAVTYRFPKDYRPDILLSETLQRALTQECLVPIVRNLLTQLPSTTILIPQEIRVSGLWTEIPQGPENRAAIRPEDVELDPIIRFNSDTARTGEFVFPIWPSSPSHSKQTFCLQTEIDVYKSWVLRRNESGLTCPHPMPEIVFREGEQLRFEYQIGRHPGLRQSTSEPTPS